MFYGNSNNNFNNTVNVNTKLYTSFSDTCMMVVNAWNQQLSLKFHPAKGRNADGLMTYAQDNTEIISTSLTVQNADLLADGLKNEIDTALAKQEAASVSIPISSGENKKILTISTDKGIVTLSLALHVSDDNKADDANILVHEFPRKTYITGYDNKSGSGNIVTVNTDYEGFKAKLETVHLLSPIIPHAISYNNAIRANRGSRNQAASNGAPSTPTSGYSAPTSNYSGNDMGDFLPFS